MRDPLAPNEATDFRFIQFSDCTVLSARLDSYGCNLGITGAIMLAVGLLNRGLLLRGGIAVGNMIHTAEVMFDPGFLAAFGKDERGAMPMISVPCCTPCTISKSTMRCCDWVARFSMRMQIAGQCYGGSHAPSVVAKWIWMERYWNEPVYALGILSKADAFAAKLQG